MRDELVEFAEMGLKTEGLSIGFLPFVMDRSKKSIERRIAVIKSCIEDGVERRMKEIEANESNK